MPDNKLYIQYLGEKLRNFPRGVTETYKQYLERLVLDLRLQVRDLENRVPVEPRDKTEVIRLSPWP